MVTLTPEQVQDAARVMPDHVLATSFMAPDVRARVIALVLFAHEIARARGVVSEAGLAAIRLQWWRDTIDQIYDGKIVRAQPTAIGLAGAIQEANLPRTLFDAMIDGHEDELNPAPFSAWADLDKYLDATFGNLNRLSLLASGLSAISTYAEEAARHAGVAWGLSHLLRAMPQWSSRRCLWLPGEVSSALDHEGIFAGHVSPQLRLTLKSVQDRISTSSKRANLAIKQAGLGAHFPALAPACLARRYGKVALPGVGDLGRISPDITLLERQVRITLSVAAGRL